MGPKSVEEHAALVRLRPLARKWGGDDLCEISGERTAFLWLFGTTMIEAFVDRDGAVVLRAFLVLEPEDRMGLEARLAPFTATLPQGRLEVDADGDIELVHRVPSGATAERLDQAIGDVCHHADRLDDILRERLGGLRAVDKFQFDVLQALGGESARAKGVV